MRQLSKNKVINKLANELIDQYGWTLRPKRNSPHNVIVDPNTHYSYPIPPSPSCWRAEKNWVAGIRKIMRGVRP